MPSLPWVATRTVYQVALTLGIFLLALPLPILAQDYCVLPTSDAFSGYRMRDGNRCEGIYGQDVAAGLFSIRSFTYFFEDFNPDTVDALVIGWPAAVVGDLWLSGRGRKGNVYYALDTSVAASVRSFSWPATILRNRAFKGRHLGFKAWSRDPTDQPEHERVHVPISVGYVPDGESHDADPSKGYRLIVTPGEPFEDIFMTIDRIGSNETVTERERASLDRPTYSARTLEIRVDAPAMPGTYRITLEGQREDGSLTIPRFFVFRHMLP